VRFVRVNGTVWRDLKGWSADLLRDRDLRHIGAGVARPDVT
jgi:hypothetical protein